MIIKIFFFFYFLISISLKIFINSVEIKKDIKKSKSKEGGERNQNRYWLKIDIGVRIYIQKHSLIGAIEVAKAQPSHPTSRAQAREHIHISHPTTTRPTTTTKK